MIATAILQLERTDTGYICLCQLPVKQLTLGAHIHVSQRTFPWPLGGGLRRAFVTRGLVTSARLPGVS